MLEIQQYISNNPAGFWLILSLILFIAEVTMFQLIGVLFLALGALLLGVLITLGIFAESSLVSQVALFLCFSGLCALILWKPLKRLKSKKGQEYSDVIGSYATVINAPLEQGKIGRVKWSGTIMRAKLATANTTNTTTTTGTGTGTTTTTANTTTGTNIGNIDGNHSKENFDKENSSSEKRVLPIGQEVKIVKREGMILIVDE